jgi:uncharacterized protein
MTTSAAAALVPPFTMDMAIKKIRIAEENWNSRDPNKVVLGCSQQSRWRNRSEFIVGREQIVAFLVRKWRKELAADARMTIQT